MDVKGSHTYAAPIDDVVAMLRDSDATVAKYQDMGHRNVAVLDCSGDSDRLRIESTRVVDVDLPGFARRALKPTNTMHQTDEWRAAADGGWDGSFAVEVQGAPVHLSGTMRLTAGPGTCTAFIAVTVTANVPFIGGRIADWLARNDVRRTVDAELSFGDQWLAAYRF